MGRAEVAEQVGRENMEYVSRGSFLRDARVLPGSWIHVLHCNLTLGDLGGEGVRSSLLPLTQTLGEYAKF